MSAAEVVDEVGEPVADDPDDAENDNNPDNPDDEDNVDPGEPEPEPEPEPQQAKSQKEIEAAMVKLDAEAVRHAKRVQEIMGDDFATLVPCPLDFTPGFIMFQPGMAMPDDMRDAVNALFGEDSLPQYLQDPTAQTCSTCGGWGECLSGGKGGTRALKACSACGGNGWIPKLADTPPLAVVPQSIAAVHGEQVNTATGEVLPPRPEPFFNPGTQKWELPA